MTLVLATKQVLNMNVFSLQSRCKPGVSAGDSTCRAFLSGAPQTVPLCRLQDHQPGSTLHISSSHGTVSSTMMSVLANTDQSTMSRGKDDMVISGENFSWWLRPAAIFQSPPSDRKYL